MTDVNAIQKAFAEVEEAKSKFPPAIFNSLQKRCFHEVPSYGATRNSKFVIITCDEFSHYIDSDSEDEDCSCDKVTLTHYPTNKILLMVSDHKKPVFDGRCPHAAAHYVRRFTDGKTTYITLGDLLTIQEKLISSQGYVHTSCGDLYRILSLEIVDHLQQASAPTAEDLAAALFDLKDNFTDYSYLSLMNMLVRKTPVVDYSYIGKVTVIGDRIYPKFDKDEDVFLVPDNSYKGTFTITEGGLASNVDITKDTISRTHFKYLLNSLALGGYEKTSCGSFLRVRDIKLV